MFAQCPKNMKNPGDSAGHFFFGCMSAAIRAALRAKLTESTTDTECIPWIAKELETQIPAWRTRLSSPQSWTSGSYDEYGYNDGKAHLGTDFRFKFWYPYMEYRVGDEIRRQLPAGFKDVKIKTTCYSGRTVGATCRVTLQIQLDED